VYVEEAHYVETAEPVVYYEEPVVEHPVAVAEPVVFEESVVAEPETEYNYFSLDAVDEEYSEPEPTVTVVHA